MGYDHSSMHPRPFEALYYVDAYGHVSELPCMFPSKSAHSKTPCHTGPLCPVQSLMLTALRALPYEKP